MFDVFSLSLDDDYCSSVNVLPKASIRVQYLCVGTTDGDVFQKKTLKSLCNLKHYETLPLHS